MAASQNDEDFDDLLAEDPDSLSPDSDDIEVNIEDDTPSADVGKLDDPDAFVDTDDEVLQYNSKVQKRIDKLTAKAETERRAREKLQREHAQAVQVLQATMTAKQQLEQERKQLREQLHQGESVYVKEVIGSLEARLASAQDKFRKAYEGGLTDDLVTAQTEIADLTHQMRLARSYKPAPMEVEPDTPAAVTPPVAQPQARPDPVFNTWRERNKWFDDGEKQDMRAVAMHVHSQLVSQGVDPVLDADKYYKTIDAQMRKRFPEHSWPDAPPRTTRTMTPGNSVAGAPRSKQQVRLSKSEVQLAESLGLTPQQYAAEKIKLERSRSRA